MALLISATLVQLVTGYLNLLDWRPFGWDFVVVHYALAYVVIGSVLLHVAIKLPDIRYGSSTRLADGDVLTEVPWQENPASHSNAGPQPPPPTAGISRRGVLLATGDRDRCRGDHQRRPDRHPAGAPRAAGRPPTQPRPAGSARRSDRRGGRCDSGGHRPRTGSCR